MDDQAKSENATEALSVQFRIKNFRSIKDSVIDISPVTVIYGRNGTGKSSVLYALLTFRNLISSPNQQANGFFNYPSLNAGGYENVVFDHDRSKSIELALSMMTPDSKVSYTVRFDETKASFAIDETTVPGSSNKFSLDLQTQFPYQANQQKIGKLKLPTQGTIDIVWNGITSSVSGTVQHEAKQESDGAVSRLNRPVEYLRRTGFVPLRRGFSKSLYSSGASVINPANEDEMASLLINSKYLVTRISHYIEHIFNRDLRVNLKPGTGFFSLDLSDNDTGLGTELINDGFGINQTVYLLSVALFENYDLILIEEPEIHLNPSSIKKLMRVLAELVQKKDKKLIITTHSEPLITSLLAAVADGELGSDDISIYLAEKKDEASKFSKQKVNENGQIEGGLMEFAKAELEDLKSILGVPD